MAKEYVFKALNAPTVTLTQVAVASNGLALGTYYVRMVARYYRGAPGWESTSGTSMRCHTAWSTEQSVAITGPNQGIKIDWNTVTDATHYYIAITTVAPGSNYRYGSNKTINAAFTPPTVTYTYTAATGMTTYPKMTDELDSSGVDQTAGYPGDPRPVLFIKGGTSGDPVTPQNIYDWFQTYNAGQYASYAQKLGSARPKYLFKCAFVFEGDSSTTGYFTATNCDIECDGIFSELNANLTFGTKLSEYAAKDGVNLYLRDNFVLDWYSMEIRGSLKFYDSELRYRDLSILNGNVPYIGVTALEMIGSRFANGRNSCWLAGTLPGLVRSCTVFGAGSRGNFQIQPTAGSTIVLDDLMAVGCSTAYNLSNAAGIVLTNPKFRNCSTGFYVFVNNATNTVTHYIVNPEWTNLTSTRLFAWQAVNHVNGVPQGNYTFILQWTCDVTVVDAKGNPIPDAWVVIRDKDNTVVAWESTAAGTGKTVQMRLTEGVYDKNTWVYDYTNSYRADRYNCTSPNPYTITVMKAGYEVYCSMITVNKKLDLVIRLRHSAATGKDIMGPEFR